MYSKNISYKTITLLGLILISSFQGSVFARSNKKEQFINNLKLKGRYLSYLGTRKVLDKSDLPELYTILDESRENMALIRCLQAIAFISDRGDDKAVKTLINYFKKPDADLLQNSKLLAKSTPDSLARRIVMDKVYTLQYMGMIGGAEAKNFLMEILTGSEAEKLFMELLNFPNAFSGGQEEIIAFLRGRAAVGIVFCQDKESIQEVKKLYYQELQKYNEIGTQTLLFQHLIDAMAYSDLIDEIGLEEVFEMHGYGSLEVLLPYLKKYLDKYALWPTIEKDFSIIQLDNFNSLPLRIPWHKVTQNQHILYNTAGSGDLEACLELINDSNAPVELTRWANLQPIKIYAESNQKSKAANYAKEWLKNNPNDPYILNVKVILAELLSKSGADGFSPSFEEFREVCDDIFEKYDIDNMSVIQTHFLMAQKLESLDNSGDIKNLVHEHLNKAKEGCQKLLSQIQPTENMKKVQQERIIAKYQSERKDVEDYLEKILSLSYTVK